MTANLWVVGDSFVLPNMTTMKWIDEQKAWPYILGKNLQTKHVSVIGQYGCSNNYLCHTVACTNNLKIDLLGKTESFLTFSTSALVDNSEDAKEEIVSTISKALWPTSSMHLRTLKTSDIAPVEVSL